MRVNAGYFLFLLYFFISLCYVESVNSMGVKLNLEVNQNPGGPSTKLLTGRFRPGSDLFIFFMPFLTEKRTPFILPSKNTASLTIVNASCPFHSVRSPV